MCHPATDATLAARWGRVFTAVVLTGVLCGCSSEAPPPVVDSASARIARLEAQLPEAELTAANWQGWCEELVRRKPSGGNQAILCSDELMRALCDPAALRERADRPGPFQAIVDFARQLQTHDVDLLVVFAPPRVAIYPESIPASPPMEDGTIPLLDWRLRCFYLALERSGVEVVDLLPTFLEHRFREGRTHGGKQRVERVYREGRSYWSSYGTMLAADVIGRRIRRYPWFGEVSAQMGIAVLVEKVVWSGGREQQFLHTVLIAGEDEGLAGVKQSLYDRSSPVLVVGDSFSREYTDSQAGLPDHLLRVLGFRVDVIAVDSGVPQMSRRALALRQDGLAGKRLVVYVIPAQWLRLNQHEGWKLVDVFGPRERRP